MTNADNNLAQHHGISTDDEPTGLPVYQKLKTGISPNENKKFSREKKSRDMIFFLLKKQLIHFKHFLSRTARAVPGAPCESPILGKRYVFGVGRTNIHDEVVVM